MKIVIAPDSFKGSLSSNEVIAHVKQSALKFFPAAQVVEVPIADGGDGTVEAVVLATGGQLKSADAQDPIGRCKPCIYGDADGKAIVGMSECSGLAPLSATERNPMNTSSHGTGDVIRHALDDGFTDIYVGIGGSATNDCGSGCMQALGLKFLRADGSEIERMCGKELIHVAAVDDSDLDPRLKGAAITIMCDVTNPLTGDNGATMVYGPQKGGTPSRLASLEEGMIHYERVLNAYAGEAVSLMPGSGAAGGIGAALYAYAGAKLTSGIDAILELVQFEKRIKDADLIITGEGKVDKQSASGKVIHGVAEYASKAGVPVVVIAGSVGDGAQVVYGLGVNTIVALPDAPMSLDECIDDAETLIKKAADRVFSLLKIGSGLK